MTITKKGDILPKTYKANEAFTLSDGEYTIKAKDIAKNETEEIKFVVDTVAPIINVNINGELQQSNTAYTDIIATVDEKNLTTDTNEVKPDVYVKDGEEYKLVEEDATALDLSINGVEYKLVYTYTDKAGNPATKEVYTKVVNIIHEVRFNKTSYEGTYTGSKHEVPTDAIYVEIKDGVETTLTATEITYTVSEDMINVGEYTITASVGNVSSTATYKINPAEITVAFNDDKTISVTFEDGTDASNYVEFEYIKVEWKKVFGISYPTYEKVLTAPVDKEYYVTVSSASANVTIAGAADIDLTWLIDGLRINGKFHKYN